MVGSDDTGAGAAAPRKRATITDVAKEAGVAASTVSRAFARPGRISAEVAQRIYDAADRLGYRREVITAVRTAHSGQLNGSIVISVPDLSNPVYADYVKSAQHQCLHKGFSLTVIDFEETNVLERKALRQAMDHTDGIILASSRSSDATIRKLAEIKPLIALNRPIRGVRSIVADPRKGLEQAIDHLADLGHASLTYLSGPETSWQEGYRWRVLSGVCRLRAMKVRRLPCDAPTYLGGFRACAEFLDNPTGAVLAYNDTVAIGFIKALQNKGVDVPADVSVIGIDDVPVSSLVTPALSTVRLARRELGELAARRLIAQITHTAVGRPEAVTFIDSSFVVRGSTAPCGR